VKKNKSVNRCPLEAFDLNVEIEESECGLQKREREGDEIRSGLDFDHASNPEIYSHIYIYT